MATEIERKFLVTSDAWRDNISKSMTFLQGYLSLTPVVRVRVVWPLLPRETELLDKAGEAYLTLKGKAEGLSRSEFEYSIPENDGIQLLDLGLVGHLIKKIRHHVYGEDGTLWELDEFFAPNKGLVVAEVELESEDQKFATPSWLGKEVSMDPRYNNSNLATNPYQSWPENKC